MNITACDITGVCPYYQMTSDGQFCNTHCGVGIDLPEVDQDEDEDLDEYEDDDIQFVDYWDCDDSMNPYDGTYDYMDSQWDD